MKFDVTDQEADYIFRTLALRPFQEVAGLLQKLQLQVKAQQPTPQEPPKG